MIARNGYHILDFRPSVSFVAIRNIHLNPPDRGSGRVLPSSRPAKASDPGSFQSSIARGPRPSHLTFRYLLERKGLPSYIEAIALRVIAARAMEICRRRPVTPPRLGRLSAGCECVTTCSGSLVKLPDQALAECLGHCFGLGMHVKLLVDSLHVERYRVDGDAQLRR